MPKKPARPRTKAGVPGSSGVKANPRTKAGDNSRNLSFDEERQLFVSIRGKWIAAQAKLKVAKTLVDDVVAEAHAAEFTKKQLMIADELATSRGELKVKAEVAERLKVARFIGHKMGAQFDLFEKADAKPQPSADRAFDEGKLASMENRPAKPGYAPETPEYGSYMNGFHEHQTSLAGGIGKLDDEDVRPRHLRQPGAGPH